MDGFRGSLRHPAVLVLAALLAIPLAASADAPSGLERLERFYEETRSLRADFSQRVTGPDGEVQERSQGEVWIEQPDRFRWEYREPHPQKIVADGETVQFYDPEMEQVTVRDFAQGLGHTPSSVLSGSGDLSRQFEIRDAGTEDGLAWVELVPRDREEAGFRLARVGLEADPVRLREFVFTDPFENRTRLRFENIRVNPALDADLFNFQPPPDADVLGGGGPNG
ncbi:MAG: outer membrane lipoprotein chaperone LolA [Thiohalorhabdus sp.]